MFLVIHVNNCDFALLLLCPGLVVVFVVSNVYQLPKKKDSKTEASRPKETMKLKSHDVD